MRYIRASGLVVLMLLTLGCATMPATDGYERAISVFQQSPQVKPFFEDAYAYAVFPSVGKGGLLFGGSYGKGQVYRRGVLTGRSSLVKLSLGAQAGGQAFRQIIFFQDKRAYDEFTRGTFELDATASAVAITAAAQARTGTDGLSANASTGPATAVQAPTNYSKGTAVFLHTKAGLMYEAAIGGQRFTFKPI